MKESYCPYCMSPINTGNVCRSCGRKASDYVPSGHHLAPGHVLKERYLLGRVLGEGGFGITYLGLDTVLNRKVAVKEYFPNIYVYREYSASSRVTCYTKDKQVSYEKGREQFLREARVMARLDHLPEIVQVLDFFSDNNTAYIVMEYIEGDTLRSILVKQNRIPSRNLFAMMEPVLRAMDIMHSAGVIHRDISPDNLILMANGRIKLLDFGCARDIDNDRSMTVMLKHGYAPMEQYTGNNQGPWTDVYAVCATMYHCLTGKIPPRALDRLGAHDALVPPRALGAAITQKQESALLKGLGVEPMARWRDIAELYAGLYGTVLEDGATEAVVEETGTPTEILIDESVPKKNARSAQVTPPVSKKQGDKAAALPASAPSQKKVAAAEPNGKKSPSPAPARGQQTAGHAKETAKASNAPKTNGAPGPAHVDPGSWRERKRWVTIALWAVSYFGFLGFHWFYEGRKGEGSIHLIIFAILIYLIKLNAEMNHFGVIMTFWVIFGLKCMLVDFIRIGNRPKVYYISKQLPGQYFENKP